MLRRIALVAALLVPGLAAADIKSDFQAIYSSFDGSVSKRDFPAVKKWAARYMLPAFTYTSRDGNKFDRASYLKGIQDQISITRKVAESWIKVRSVRVAGAVATVEYDSNTSATVAFDSQELRLEDKDHCVDTWVKAGPAWKLKRSVQKTADTQMYPKS